MNTHPRRSGPGRLIAFEGIDGCGKTTQVRLLFQALIADGYRAVCFREPTDGPFGRRIRALTEEDRDTLAPEEELRWFVEDRREDVRLNLAPALRDGRVVLLDRYYLSTAAYQGARGIPFEEIIRENERFAPVPDLFILLQAPVAPCLARITGSRGAVDPLFEKSAYLEQVARIFDSIKHDKLVRFDAMEEAGVLASRIKQAALSLLPPAPAEGSPISNG